MKIAIPITAQTTLQAEREIKDAPKGDDIVLELRIDYLLDLNYDNLRLLLITCNSSQRPVIVTNRHKYEAGPDPKAGFKEDEIDRLEYLLAARELGATYVDIEFDYCRRDFLPLLMRRAAPMVILSYHNFEETPDKLLNIAERMSEKKPFIVKMAAKANSVTDCIRIGAIVRRIYDKGQKVIGIGMGDEEYAKETRFNPINYFVYAVPTLENACAQGQVTVKEARARIKELPDLSQPH